MEEKLKSIYIEDFIWVIYIGIIILSFYSNYLEKKYYINNDIKSKDKYNKIMIFIFIILVVVYFYFFSSSLKDLNNLKDSDTYKKKRLTYLAFIASTLVLLSGIIFLYIAVKNDDIDVELAFS